MFARKIIPLVGVWCTGNMHPWGGCDRGFDSLHPDQRYEVRYQRDGNRGIVTSCEILNLLRTYDELRFK